MARNGFGKLLKEFDRVAATTVYNGPRAAAERVIRELQQTGPSWSGKFSNSWQISTPSTTVKGTGTAGEPQPVVAPTLTGREVTKSFFLKDSVVFRITNFSPHALEAIDAIENNFYRPTPRPTTQLGLNKWEVLNEGRPRLSLRGKLGGGVTNGESSRTAPLDWFATYASSNLGRAVQIEMDSVLRRRFA